VQTSQAVHCLPKDSQGERFVHRTVKRDLDNVYLTGPQTWEEIEVDIDDLLELLWGPAEESDERGIEGTDLLPAAGRLFLTSRLSPGSPLLSSYRDWSKTERARSRHFGAGALEFASTIL